MPLKNKNEDALNPATQTGEKQAPAKKKKSLAEIQVPNWLAAVLIIGLVVLILLVFFFSNRKPSSQAGTQFASEASSQATEVEVLPQRVRSYTGTETSNPFQSDSIGDVRLTGIISNSAGKSTVILESTQASYIVSEGDTLPNSQWQVSKVGENYVTLTLDGNDKVIWMNGQETESASASGVTTTESTQTSGGANE